MRIHVLINGIIASALAVSLGAAPASQPATDANAPELTARQQNLLVQLSDAEANIQAINKALKATGYSVGIAYDSIDSSLKGNEIMDRKGGGPVRWDAFYGKTARAYATSGWGDHRPQQFDFVYKANNNQIARAKDQIASLAKDQESLLARRQKHEADQSRLWATLSWELVKDREIDVRPLYRHPLRPEGAQASVLRPIILFLRATDSVAEEGLNDIQGDQAGTFRAGSRRMEAAYSDLQQSLADLLDGGDLKPDQEKQGKALKAICKNLAEECKVIAENYDNALDRDGAKEDGSKLQFRGQLQSSLSSFANETVHLDDEIVRTAKDWGVKADKSVIASQPVVPTSNGPAWTSGTIGGNQPVSDPQNGVPGRLRTVDLLALVVPDRDTTMGQWTYDRNGLESGDQNEEKRIRLAYHPPEEYDFVCEFTVIRIIEWGDIGQVFSAHDRIFEWLMGGNRNTQLTFAGSGFGFNSNTTRRSRVFEAGRSYRSVVQVRHNKLTAFIDGTLSGSLNTDFNQFIPSPRVSSYCGVLGIRTFDQVLFHKIEAVEISGRGQIIGRLDAQRIGKTSFEWPQPIGSTTSLIDLQPRVVQVGFDQLRKNQTPDGRPVIVDGRHCDRFLFAHAPSSLIYDIPAGAMGFRATATSAVSGKGVQAVIYVDGNEALISKTLDESNGQIPIALPLPKNARQIELRFSQMGSNSSSWSVWANPEFVFAQ